MQTVKTYRTLNDYRICPEPMFDDSQASNSSKIAKGALLVALVLGVGSYVYSVTEQPRAVAQSDNQGTTQNAQGTVSTAAPDSAQNAQAVVAPTPATDSGPSAAGLRAAAAEQTTTSAAPLKKAAPEPGIATPSTKTKVARAARNTEEQSNSATTNTAQSSPDASDISAEPASPMATTPAAEPSAPVVTVPPATASDPTPVANVGDDSANPAG